MAVKKSKKQENLRQSIAEMQKDPKMVKELNKFIKASLKPYKL
jgi:hypothetical protein